MALTVEKENAILKKMLMTMLVNNAICIANLPERISSIGQHIGESPEEVLEIISPLLKEAMSNGLDPEKLKSVKDDDHHHNYGFNFWHSGH